MSVCADDVTAAVAAAVDALQPAAGADWSVRAGDLEWDCWETAEHIADDLFFYAAQLGAPGYSDYLPLRAEPNRPGGEPNTIRVVAETGPAGLFTALGITLVRSTVMKPSTSPAAAGSSMSIDKVLSDRARLLPAGGRNEPAAQEVCVDSLRTPVAPWHASPGEDPS